MIDPDKHRGELEQALRALEDRDVRPRRSFDDWVDYNRWLERMHTVLWDISRPAANAWLQACTELPAGPVRLHPQFREVFSVLARASLEHSFPLQPLRDASARAASICYEAQQQKADADDDAALAVLKQLAQQGVVTDAAVVNALDGVRGSYLLPSHQSGFYSEWGLKNRRVRVVRRQDGDLEVSLVEPK